MRSLFRFLNRESGSLHSAAYLLGAFAVLSQVLAFVRDRTLAHTFGASAALDSYYAAFRIPDFLFVTVASVVSLSVLVPFIVEREKHGREEVRRFIDDIFSFFSALILAVSLAAFFLIPVLSPMLFKGLSGDALAKVIVLSRVFLLSPIFLGFSNLLGSLTQAYNRFISYAAAPLFYNLGIILGTVFLAPRFGVLGVALGVVGGSFMNMAFQVPFVARLGLLPRLSLGRMREGLSNVRRVFVLSVPRTLSLSVNHIAQIFLISLASLMPVGSISIYSFALNIQSVPLSIIGVSYSLAAFPTLTRHFAEKRMEAFVEQMATTARHIIFWSLPATALFIMLRTELIRVLLGLGRFSFDDMRLTAAALAVFSVSALAQCLLLLFTRAFYSAGHTRKPFLINFLSALVTVGLAYGFVRLFYSWAAFRASFAALLGVPGLDTNVLMLPLGYAVGTILNAAVHWYHFEKDFGGFSRRVWKTSLESLAASLMVAAGTYGGLELFRSYFSASSLAGALFLGLASGGLGIALGVITLHLIGNAELKEALASVRIRIWGPELSVNAPENIDAI